MRPELRIRPARQADHDDICALETLTFGSDAWSEATMREELNADHRDYFVLVDPDERVHGYAGLLAVGQEGDVQTIAVAAQARGHGYGKALLTGLLDRARELQIREVFLEVRADNPVAISLYASLGFAELGVRPGYYQPDGVDAIVMRRREPVSDV